ncbi:aminotransferase class IV family protein [Ruegeria sp. R13_0]|uniref:aminotransferase class IV family protein n=1 Tax=Ruegeria sp. R13_0 TaxID=2821099 RepID=UPI001ADC05A8|nr:aminotransferase class IV family protein [Ruegeria sp. R13_0]MBO9433469.1 aminotransferase class IV family protein [Ruegeria sp. R13_0]
MESPLRPPVEPDFRLIETLGFHPDQGFLRRDRHLDRMARTAKALSLSFDRNAALAILSDVTSDTSLRCRLTMDVYGGFDLTAAALARNPEVWRLVIPQTRLNSDDFWLQHKTTRRAVYDSARASLPDDVDELLFLNEREELCEGTITNLFVEMPDGRRLTPPVSSGLLPGILREEMLEEDWAEAVLNLNDLKSAKAIYMGNSLRGLIPANLVVL